VAPNDLQIRVLSEKNKKFKLVQTFLEKKLKAYNQQKLGPSHMKNLGLFIRGPKGRLIGGLVGFTFRGWLFTTLFWVERRYRNRGLGRWLLRKAEKLAWNRGCERARVETGNFQAPYFYPKLGYRRVGGLRLSKKISENIFIRKFHRSDFQDKGTNNIPALLGLRVEVLTGTASKFKKTAKLLHQRLVSFSANKAGAFHHRNIVLEARTRKNRLVGGLSGETQWQWLNVNMVWLDPAYRGKGWGTRLFKMTQAKALQRGCRHVVTRRYDFQAPDYFKKLGFQSYTRIKDYPKGHNFLFLTKNLK
jgi:GNAT superfamily N-acetyltransferase